MMFQLMPEMWVWMIPLLIWTAVWKGIGLWKSGRNNQLPWFVAMFILSTAGLLPIVYLVWFQKKPRKSRPKKRRKR